tara:strand:+ start:1768 stop:2610 length:843 start_codon:yes stop_codon:yes gene_type:complete
MFKARNLRIIAANCWQGQRKSGVDWGPSYLTPHIHKNHSDKIVSFDTVNETAFHNKNMGFQELHSQTLKNMRDKESMSIVLGGDHSISGATLAATQNSGDRSKVIWIDAHADINTYESSPSGNIHGMPIACAMHLIQPWVNAPPLKKDDLIYIGIRDLDPFEKDYIKNEGITAYFMEDIHDRGISNVMDEVQERIEGENVHVSFDIDALDMSIVPSTGTPVTNGLTLNDMDTIIDSISSVSNVRHCDFTEVNPCLGTDKDVDLTVQSMMYVINRTIDKNI